MYQLTESSDASDASYKVNGGDGISAEKDKRSGTFTTKEMTLSHNDEITFTNVFIPSLPGTGARTAVIASVIGFAGVLIAFVILMKRRYDLRNK